MTKEEAETRVAEAIAQDFPDIRYAGTDHGEIQVEFWTGELVTLEVKEVNYRWR